MTTTERKQLLVTSIRRMEDKIVILKYDYNGCHTFREQTEEIEALQKHLRGAHTALLLLIEEELAA